jgi:hypothetical protein
MADLRAHWKAQRRDLSKSPKAKRTGGFNDCFRPSAGASKADLKEFHQEEMALRRRHRWDRQSSYSTKAWYKRFGLPVIGTQKREAARRLRQQAARA